MKRRDFLKSCILIGSGVTGTNWFYQLWKRVADKKQVVALPEPMLGIYDGFTFHDTYYLHPYQEELLNSIYDNKHKRLVMHKGRMMGKSYCEAILKEGYRNHSEIFGRKKLFSKRHRKGFRNSKSFRI